jgi:transcriptional regulator with XRE-family HTH domain
VADYWDEWEHLPLRELEELQEQLRFALREAELELSQASTRLYDRLTLDGKLSQEQVARSYGVTRGTISKLQNRDGDPDWSPPSAELYNRFERSVEAQCSRLRARAVELRARHGRLTRLIRDRTLDADVAQESFDAYSDELGAYLASLKEVLSRTLPWQPEDSFSSVFADRRVKVVQEPLLPAPVDGRVHLPTRQIVEGDIDWDEAAAPLRRMVVLGDAGYGKTWLLRRHAQELCDRALTAIATGIRLDEIEIPAWLHATDLVHTWQQARDPMSALLVAVSRAPLLSGFVPSRDLDRLFTKAFANGKLCLHIDGFDEVYSDADNGVLVDCLRWLGSQIRHDSGPRLILASRPAGFESPFQEGDAWPRTHFLFLGALSLREVEAFWLTWYTAKSLNYPRDRLESVLSADSPLREYVRIPLVAAFCAWVAENDQISPTVAGLFAQVMDKFVRQSWKLGSHAPAASVTRSDPLRWMQIRDALEQLAWFMATDKGSWHDVAERAEAEAQLAMSGFEPLPGWTRTGEIVRIQGVLVPLMGAFDGPLLWVHPSLHQFLVARRLVTLPEEDVAHWVRLGQLRPEWAETLRFAVELEADDGQT